MVFVCASCAILARYWLEVSGMASRDLVRQFVANDLILEGTREVSMQSHLDRYIPIAAALGGICVGLLTVFADFMGAIGSGTGILLATNIIYSFYEQYENDKKKKGNVQVY